MTKIITPLQCRGARAILDMTRDELATLSGIPSGTIGKFETESAETRLQSVSTLRLTLESVGIEFIDTDGVMLRKNHIRTFEGKKAHRIMLDEIYEDMKDKGGEILIKGLDESCWDSGDDKAFLNHHIDRLLKSNVTERLLICETDEIIATHEHWYRTVPAQYFSRHTQWIWNGKVGMVTWGDIEKITIIESNEMFDTSLKDFNFMWDNGTPLK